MSDTTTSPDGARATLRALELPFREAIDFMAGKTNATSQSYLDVWAEAHSRSFMVAGAATDSLVQDFRDAVTRALEQGTTLADFRKDFDAIVETHGWSHTGTAGWRARIIFETNLSTAYSAGRYAQSTEPDTLAVYPYWQYVHSRARNPREQHAAWDGKILRADDPWWRAHYPPNGWRCGCRVDPVSARELQRMGRDGPDPSPRVVTREWRNPKTGEVRLVPVGVDPGFDYNPGEAWKGHQTTPGVAERVPPPDYPPPPPGLPVRQNGPISATTGPGLARPERQRAGSVFDTKLISAPQNRRNPFEVNEENGRMYAVSLNRGGEREFVLRWQRRDNLRPGYYQQAAPRMADGVWTVFPDRAEDRKALKAAGMAVGVDVYAEASTLAEAIAAAERLAQFIAGQRP